MSKQATHTRGLSFDGKGVNGPDEYRTRLATFHGEDAAERYGNLFAAAPDLLAALEMLAHRMGLALNCVDDDDVAENENLQDDVAAVEAAHAAIAKAKGN